METFSTLPVPVNSPHKGRWHEALMFPLICVWINGWENNHKAGDLKRYRAHYDVIIICADIGTRSGFKGSIYSHWHWNNCMITRANVTHTGLGKMDHYITTKKKTAKHEPCVKLRRCNVVLLYYVNIFFWKRPSLNIYTRVSFYDMLQFLLPLFCLPNNTAFAFRSPASCSSFITYTTIEYVGSGVCSL